MIFLVSWQCVNLIDHKRTLSIYIGLPLFPVIVTNKGFVLDLLLSNPKDPGPKNGISSKVLLYIRDGI